NEEKVLNRIRSWRDICPDMTIRSTFITGFPGETEAHFQYLLDWLKEAQLDRVGCFKYEAVEGAPANELAGAVPEDVKQERWERFMETQQAISTARLEAKIGKTVEVIIDEVVEEGAVGRTAADAPEIDGNIFLDGQTHLQPGQIVTAVVDDADEYDLWGTLV